MLHDPHGVVWSTVLPSLVLHGLQGFHQSHQYLITFGDLLDNVTFKSLSLLSEQ